MSSWTSSTAWGGSSPICDAREVGAHRFLRPRRSTPPVPDELIAKRARSARALALDGPPRGPLVGDRQRLTQALIELVQNAVQHTNQGDADRARTQVGDGEARLWVRDTGSGVPDADQERIFERFARAAGPPPRRGGGLGLSIVRAIAEAHGGRVELDSRPGGGDASPSSIPPEPPRR